MVKKPKHEDSSDEETFHVEVILKAKVAVIKEHNPETGKDEENMGWEYYVKWAGYDSDSDSWEPQGNLAQCDRLLKSFWDNVGHDNQDYPLGFEITPSEAWIQREKTFFHKTFGETVAESCKKAEHSNKGPAGKAVKTKAKKKKPGWVYVSVSESESEGSDKPLKVKGKRKRARKASREVNNDSDSSPDEPLRKASKKARTADKGKGKAKEHEKGKAPALPRAPSPHRKDDRSDEAGSLFSAPSSPEVKTGGRKLPLPSSSMGASGRTTNSVASTSTLGTSTSGAGPSSAPAHPPRPAISHRNKEPKVKMMPIPTTGSTLQGISTKAKLAGSRKSTDNAAPAPAVPDPLGTQAKKSMLANLSFKKKSTLEHPSAGPSGSSSADPRRRPSLMIPEHSSNMVDSPLSMHSDLPAASPGGWGAGSPGGWGAHSPGAWGANSPGGWGANSPGGWGADLPVVDNQSSPWGDTSGSTSWGQTTRPQHTSTTSDLNRSASSHQTIPLPRAPPHAQPRAPQPSTSSRQIDLQAAATEFLASIMPKELAAPMHEPDGHEPLPVVPLPRAKPTAKAQPQIKIQKRWAWDGELLVESGPTQANKLCNIRMTDATAHRPDGLRINICYNAGITNLRLQKFHDFFDINIILRACAPIQQFCKVCPQTDADLGAFKTLTTYMARKRVFTYAHVELLSNPVGLLIIFPAVHTDLCTYLKAPKEVSEGARLVAMLVPWAITIDNYNNEKWFKSRQELSCGGGRLDAEVAKKLEGHPALGNSFFALGLRIHGFNSRLYDFLARAPRDYCLWTDQAEGSTSRPGFETKMLVTVLDACKARNVGYKQDVRVIFVHVGALKSFYKLQALAMRRSKQPALRFYSYGTHPTVSPDRWGLREIYPTGGVLTFTPSALLQNPHDVCALLEKVDKHPLWLGYVHPYTVATATKLLGEGLDTSRAVDSFLLIFYKLIELIESGKLGLLRAPPSGKTARQIHNGPSPGMEWVGWMMGLGALNQRQTVLECIKLLDDQHGRVAANKLCQVVEDQVVHDLWQMQLQPSIMYSHRRFVVIRETQNSKDEEREGVELTSAVDFSFKDDFFRR